MIWNRRKFIQRLSLAFTGLTLGALASDKRKQTGFKLTTLKVAGLQYHNAKAREFMLREKLCLIREKDNPYDRYAVALYSGELKVGYIPKENSRIFASMLDNGMALDVEVRYFDKNKPIWERLWVSVWQKG
ncbi:MAG: HIRAN domain-containing protein [Sulfurovum sp.]|nr:HIRAN domain-containing protein [Sulfurovum sp.]